MKTFAALIRRYVLATAGIILLVVALLLGMTVYTGVRYSAASGDLQKVGTLAEALHPTADGLQFGSFRGGGDSGRRSRGRAGG